MFSKADLFCCDNFCLFGAATLARPPPHLEGPFVLKYRVEPKINHLSLFQFFERRVVVSCLGCIFKRERYCQVWVNEDNLLH